MCRAMCAVKSEKMISVGLIVVRTEWSVVWDERVVVVLFFYVTTSSNANTNLMVY